MAYKHNQHFSPLRMRDHPNGHSSSVRIYNNTIVVHGVLGLEQMFNLDWIDTLDVRNNNFISYAACSWTS